MPSLIAKLLIAAFFLFSFPTPCNSQQYTLLTQYDKLSSPPNIFEISARTGTALNVTIIWPTHDFIELYIYHPARSTQYFSNFSAVVEEGSDDGPLTGTYNVFQDANMVVRLFVWTLSYVEYQIIFSIDGEEQRREPITSVASNRSLTLAPFEMASAHSVRVTVTTKTPTLPAYLFKSTGNLSNPEQALAENTSSSNTKIFITEELPGGQYYVVVPNPSNSSYEFITVRISVDCSSEEIWNSGFNDCVVDCSVIKFAISRISGTRNQCNCDDGYLWDVENIECVEEKDDSTTSTVAIAVGASLGSVALIAAIITLILWKTKKWCFYPKTTQQQNPNQIQADPKQTNPYLKQPEVGAESDRKAMGKDLAGQRYIND